MKYGTIENVKKPVSRLIFGTSNSAFRRGEDCSTLLDQIKQMGVTAFDTARAYGKAENVLGKWMISRSNRNEVVIISKGGHPALFIPRMGVRTIRKDFLNSCRALQTDYIDVYLLHRDAPHRQVGDYVELLNELHSEGRIGAFGGSNRTHRRIEEANEYAYKKNLVPFTVSSPYFGLADMKGDPFGNGAVSIAGPQNEKARKWYQKTGISMCAYSTLGRGFFSGHVKKASDIKGWARRGFATKDNFERLRRTQELAKQKGCSTAQIALAWIFKQPMNCFAIITASDIVQMKQNTQALNFVLTEEEAGYLDLK